MKNINKYIVFFFAMMLFLTGCQEEAAPIEQEANEKEQTSVGTQEVQEDEKESAESEQDSTSQGAEVIPTTQAGKPMTVHFIDVGQGDSILIQTPNGKTMLIDGGVKGEGKKVVEYIRSLQIKKLDYVVATHPDADHIGGLISVLNSIKIGHFIDSGKVHTSQTFENMIQLVSDKNIPYTVPRKGEQIDIDAAITTEVILADEYADDNNEASIVIKMTYGNVSYLFTGDAGIKKEQEMLKENIRATVLKAGHHGSNTSSSEAFIRAVNPEVAILSYGQDNKYGHPHAEVVNNLRAVNSKIYGTGESGTIIVTTDGVTYTVNKAEWTGIGATSSINPKPVTTKPSEQNVTAGKVRISSKDLQQEIVGITNDSNEEVSLKGWKLLSVEGNQTFNFPNISLNAGATIYVTSGSDAAEGQGYLKWTGRQIWLNDGDKAILYNAKGEIVDELD